ncbi:cupin domain-containing protein [Methylobacterium sp. Leaf85]|uniref:cupin domain-containing protein n=1 Tax=Methylobacterium sp. Leaf85 TaxID=1736241 RepID=UPI0007019355|nr:cupin domain-containing protein [Methylobacterium sp. Leaf85]KQO54092.1 hypothetical protein ASF08_15825 [Methylobacterium sp. Leaf85]
MSGVIDVPGFRGTVIGTVGTMTIVRGTLHGELAAHVAETDELVVLLSGAIVVQVDGSCKNLQPGDCSVIPKGTEHRVSAADPSLVVIVAR